MDRDPGARRRGQPDADGPWAHSRAAQPAPDRIWPRHRTDADRDAADAAAAADHHEPDGPESGRCLASPRCLEMADLLPGDPAADAAGLDRACDAGRRFDDARLHLAIVDRRGATGLAAPDSLAAVDGGL